MRSRITVVIGILLAFVTLGLLLPWLAGARFKAEAAKEKWEKNRPR